MSEETLAATDSSAPDTATSRAEPSEATPDKASASLSRDVGISAVTVTLFVLLRIFAVSKWDWDRASDIAETVDFGSAPTIVLGTLFAEPDLTAIFIMLLLPLVVLDALWPEGGEIRPSVSRILSIAVLGIVAISLTMTRGTWWLPIGAILFVMLVVGMHRSWRHSAAHKTVVRTLRSVGLIAILGVLGLAATISTPWTVREHIETTNGTINGHVLETPSGYLKVLDADSSEVIIVVSSDVISRQIAGD